MEKHYINKWYNGHLLSRQIPVYEIHLIQTPGGTIYANPMSGFAQTEVTLSNTPNSHYTFNDYEISGSNLYETNKFKFVDSDVTAMATWLQDPIRSLSIMPSEGGSIGANKMSGYDNDVVTLSNTADTGYQFGNYSLTGATLTSNQFKFNGNNVTAIGVFNEYIDPNPLNLPPNTVRVRTNDGNVPNTSSYTSIYGNVTRTSYETATKVAGTNDVYDVYKSGTSFENLLWYSTNVVEVLGANTTNITNMNSMLNLCSSLNTVALFDTSNVTSMQQMFRNCNSLSSIPLFNTSNVTDMGDMFFNCNELSSIPLLNTSNVTSMKAMFQWCSRLTTVPLFDTSNVIDMSQMFDGCSLTSVPLFNTSKVTNMDGMFAICPSLTSVPLFNTSKVTTMNYMFKSCESLTNIPLFDTSNVTSTKGMFYECTSLLSVPLFDTSKAIDMYEMFNLCYSLTSIPLFDTSNVTNMSYMFNKCRNVQSGALALYQQASTQNIIPLYHGKTFSECGINTQTGAAELAQIPSDWK